MLQNNKEIFSIRKFKNGRSDSVKIGALALLMGTALAFGGGEAQAKVGGIEIPAEKGPAEGVEVNKIEFSPNAFGNYVDKTEENGETVVKNTNLNIDYRLVEEVNTNTPLETVEDKSTNSHEISHATKHLKVEWDYEMGRTERFISDGLEYLNYKEVDKTLSTADKYKHAVDSPLADTPKEGEIKTIAGKKYEYVRTDIVKEGSLGYEESFNGANVQVTSENLHKDDTADINYTNIPAGNRVILVEEISGGKYGKFVVTDGVTSDQDVADKFYAGEANAKIISQEELDKIGGLKDSDYIVVFDRDNYHIKDLDFSTYPYGPEIGKRRWLEEIENGGLGLKSHPELYSLSKVVDETTSTTTITIEVKPGVVKRDNFGRVLKEISNSFKSVSTIRPYGTGEIDGHRRISWVESDGATEWEEDLLLIEGDVPISPNNEYKTTLTPLRAYKVASDTVINHVYRLKTEEVKDGELINSKVGKVTVEYVSEDGAVLNSEVVVAETAVETTQKYITKSGDVEISRREEKTPIDVDYDTTKLKTDTKEFGGKKYYFIKLDDLSKPEIGKVTDGETKVIYVYREIVTEKPTEIEKVEISNIEIKDEEKDGQAQDSKFGKVTVEYVSEDRTVLESKEDTPKTAIEKTQGYVIKTQDGVVLKTREEKTLIDVNYDTTDLKLKTLELNGKKYNFVKVEDNSAPEIGKVVDGETKVVYVYREEVETKPTTFVPAPPEPLEKPEVTKIKGTPLFVDGKPEITQIKGTPLFEEEKPEITQIKGTPLFEEEKPEITQIKGTPLFEEEKPELTIQEEKTTTSSPQFKPEEKTETKQDVEKKQNKKAGALPKTSAIEGNVQSNVSLPAGLIATLVAAGLVAAKRRREEER